MKNASNGWACTARRALAQAIALGLVCVCGPLAAAGASDEAKLTVTAAVMKRASLKVLAQPAAVMITTDDIARGYVEVPAPAQVAIQSNSPSGYLLEFATEADFMRHILVKGLDTDVQVGPLGGAVMQPSSGSGVTRVTLALRFRFELSESARQGTYSWPIRLSVAPL